MKKFLKKILIIVGVFSLFSIIFYLISFFGNKILVEKNSNFITNGIGAFMGAFFAFLFLISERLFGKIYSRNKKHRNALIKVEYTLNEYLSINYDNIFIIKAFIEAINKKLICVNHFTQLKIDRDTLLDLYNIDFINDLHTFNIKVYKANESLETAFSWYNNINESFLDKKIDRVAYDINLEEILKKFQTLETFLESLDKDIMDIQAKVWVLLEEESMIDWFVKIISRKERYPDGFIEKHQKRLKIIKAQIEQNTAKSKEEIDRLLQ